MKNNSPGETISELKLRSQIKLASQALHDVLCAVFREHKAADRVLAAWFRQNPRCGSRDRQFIAETVFGVWRCWRWLRLVFATDRLAALESGRAAPASAELHRLLEGACAIERPPYPAAAFLSGGGAVSGSRGERALSFLHRIGVPVSEAEKLPPFPPWVASLAEPDFPLEAYADSLSRRPPMWIRLQGTDPDASWAGVASEGLPFGRHPRVERAAFLPGNCRVNLYTLPSFRAGLFEVQDLASQAIGMACAPGKGERWLDLCAGAGGKTLQLADLMERRGTVVASDIRFYKLEDLRHRARRAGFPNIRTRAWDGQHFQTPRRTPFDGVLVDAPCSCSGVWRRNPDGPWTLTEAQVEEMAALQRSILEKAVPAVKPGGVLVYATCSFFARENRENVEKFLASHPEFRAEAFPDPLTGASVDSGMLAICPGENDCDAMFVARLRRDRRLAGEEK